MNKFCYEMVRSYQSFQSVEELDQAVRGFLYKHKISLSDGTLKVLQYIWRHSVKVFGVSFALYQTIAKEVGLHKRTVIRAVNKLVELGLIKKVPTSRESGKQGVNLLIIQPHPSVEECKNIMSPHDVTLSVTPIKATNKQRSLCENNNKPINVKKQQQECHPNKACHPKEFMKPKPLDHSFLPKYVDEQFVHAADPFFHADKIFELWQRAMWAHKKSGLKKPLSKVVNAVIEALKYTILMHKSRQIHSTFEGFFYSVLLKKLKEEREKERHYEDMAVRLFEQAKIRWGITD